MPAFVVDYSVFVFFEVNPDKQSSNIVFFSVFVCGRVCMVGWGWGTKGQMYVFSLYTGTYILIKKGEVDKCLKEKQTNKEGKKSPKVMKKIYKNISNVTLNQRGFCTVISNISQKDQIKK